VSFIKGYGTIQLDHRYGVEVDAASSSDKTFEYTQAVPSSQWNVAHNLGKFPSITEIDSADTVVTGSYTYIDNNNTTLNFSAPFAGKAYLN
jgi:hypothetical protein